jgi:hypothetical protein
VTNRDRIWGEAKSLSPEEELRVECFLYLTRLEMGLRRFLEAALQRAHGRRWWKALPQDVRAKVADGNLDYLDFPDLKKCIGAKWRELQELDVLQHLSKKDQVLVHLEELEPIRNDVAHSRSVTPAQLLLVSATYALLEPVIQEFLTSADPKSSPPAHPAIVTIGLQRALDKSHPIPDELLAALGTLVTERPELSHAKDAVEAYDRIRRRPGRRPALLAQARGDALATLAPLLHSEVISA